MRHNWPWFTLAGMLCIAAVVLGPGTPGGIAALATLVTFFLACSRALGEHYRDDPERLRTVVREDAIMGLIAAEFPREKRRRRPREAPPDDERPADARPSTPSMPRR